MKKIIRIVIALALIGAGTAAVFFGELFLPEKLHTVVEATNAPIVFVDKTPEKIEKAKDATVALLEKCESAGNSPETGIIVFDTNNKASIGVLQMQKPHVQHFYKVLYGKEVTGQEAVIIAITPEKARALAKDVLFETDRSWREWYNCGMKLGLEQRIKVIKELEQ
jgi:acyl-coenzyme A synthetase/AMP-(fatty) acid ligase